MKKNQLIIWLLILICAKGLAQTNKDTPNLSFDDGSLNGWKLYTGIFYYEAATSSYVFNWTPRTPAQTGNRLKIIGGTSLSNDPVVACSGFSTNPYNKVVARIGEPIRAEGNGSRNAAAERMEYSFKVTPNTTLLSYKLAAVLKVPALDNHTGEQRPTFSMDITVTDANGVSYTLPCSNYSSKADNGNTSLTQNNAFCPSSIASVPADYVYQKWVSGNIDLSAQIGKTVTINITNHDCLLLSNGNVVAGSHDAYGYFWAETKKIALTSSSCENSDATITAPQGFTSYVWTRSDGRPVVTPNPAQPWIVTIDKSLNLPGIVYSCAMDDANSSCGAITVSSTITPIKLHPDFSNVAVDAGKIQFTNLSTADGDTITDYYWDFGDGMGFSNVKDPIYTYSEFKQFPVKLTVTSKNGCSKTISHNVLPTKELIANIFPPAYLGYNGQTKDFTATTNIAGLQMNIDYFIRYTNLPGTPFYNSYSAPATVGDYRATFELSYLSLIKYFMTTVPSQTFTITKAPLTIEVNSVSKTYGDKISLQREGFKQSMNPLFAGDKIYELELKCSGLSDTASIGNYVIKADSAIGLGVRNYDIQFVTGTLTVNPKALSIEAIDMYKVYGSTVLPTGKEFYIAPTGLVVGDTVKSVSLTSLGFSQLGQAGNHIIQPSAAIGNRLWNYTISYKTSNILVDRKQISIAANNIAKMYGTPYVFSGKEYSTDLTQLVGQDSISKLILSSGAIAQKASVGDYAISATGVQGFRLENYDITLSNALFKVLPMPLQITATTKQKEYGDLLSFVGTEFKTDKWLVPGDTILFVTLKSDGSIESAPIGSHTITASQAYGTGLLNYDISYVSGTLNVVKKVVIASIFPPAYLGYNAQSKNFTATLNVSGLVLNSDYFIRYTNQVGTANYNSIIAPSAAGDYVATFELSNSSLQKYELLVTPTLNFTITKAPLTITVDNVVKTYGEKLTLQRNAFKTDIKPLFGTDNISEIDVASIGVTDTASVGNYAITSTKAYGVGVDNYAISFVDGNLVVNKKALTVRALDITKTYGDEITNAGSRFFVDSHYLVGTDTVSNVSVQCTGLAANASVGLYPITISAASGRRLTNYQLTYTDATLNVTKKKLTVAAKTLTKPYGNEYPFSNSDVTFDKTELVGTDTISQVQLSSLGATRKSSTGVYALTIGNISGKGLDNYEIQKQNNTLEVTPIAITVTAKDMSKPYGGLLSFAGTEFTTDKYMLNGDTIAYVSLKSSGCSETAPVGEYDITASQAYGSGANNYVISYVLGKLNVVKRLVNPSITPPAYLGYNGGTKDFKATVDVSGLVLNADYYIRYTNRPGTPAYNSITAPSAAGDYTATFEMNSASLLKYQLVTTPTQDFTITKAPLTITVDDAVKTYGDKIILQRNAFKTDIKPLFGSDNVFELDVNSAAVADTASVGAYPIIATRALGNGLDNYDIRFVSGTYKVNQKLLTVRAVDGTKTYGESVANADKRFFVDTRYLIANDTVTSVTVQCAGLPVNAAVGIYPIKISDAKGRRLNNYLITYADATLNVIKKKLIFTAQNISKQYGTVYNFKAADCNFDVNSMVGADKISSIQLSSIATQINAPIGDYNISINNIIGIGLDNYDIVLQSAIFSVTKKPIIITPNNLTKTYSTLLTFTGNEFSTDSVLVAGDAISYVVLKSGGCAETAAVGDYEISSSQPYGVGMTNYEFIYKTGLLSVIKREIIADIRPPLNLVYNALNKEFSATVNVPNLIQNTDYFIHYISKPGTKPYNSYTAPAQAGDYNATFELSELSQLKYSMAVIPSKDFTITKAPLTITANSASKVYGEKAQLLGDAFKMDMTPLYGNDAIFMVDFICGGIADTASVNTYSIIPQRPLGAGVENYDIKFVNGQLTVHPKPLLVRALDGSKIYGDIAFPNSKNFYVDARDMVGDDKISTVTLSSDGYQSLATVGAYPIKPSNAVSNRIKNYAISYIDGNMQVLKKKITVAAKQIFKVYGNEYVFKGDEFIVNAAQMVGNDRVTGVILNSLGAQHKASVGEYTLSVSEFTGNGLENYDIAAQNAILFVTPKPIVVIGKDVEKEFGDVYTFIGNEFTTDIPLLNNDTISFTFLRSAGASDTAPIGVYDIIPAQASGAGSLNYSISYRTGKLTVVKKSLQVTAKSYTKEYGQPEPEKTFTVSDNTGKQYQPTMFSGALTRDPGERVGVYKITKGTLSVLPSYAYTFAEGQLEIVKATPVVEPVFSNNGGQFVISDVIGAKDGENPTGSVNVKIVDANFENTDAVVNGVNKTAINGLPPHKVQVTVNYLGDQNYLPASATMNIYALVYHCNGGNVLVPVIHFDGSESLKIENPSREDNYKFEGWYETPDFSGEQIRRIPIATYRDVHLYAKWTATFEELSIVVLFNQVLAVANPLNHEFLYKSTYKWYKDGVLLPGNKQYCGFENYVPSGTYKVEIYYQDNPALVLELIHTAKMQKSKAYPNPLMKSAELTINTEWAKEDGVTIEIYNAQGVQLKSVRIDKVDDKFKLFGFPISGMYVIRVVQNGSIKETHKVIVEE